MSIRSHEEYQENIGAYVLGALPELEAEVLERHMAGCGACRAEVEQLRPVTAAMNRSVPQVEPPASLKASLMRTVSEEAALRAPAAAKAPREKRRWNLFSGWQPRMAMGMAVALLALGIAIGSAIDDGSGGGDQTNTVAAQVNRELMKTGEATLEVSGGNAKLSLQDAPQLPDGRVYQLWYQHGKTIERGGTFVPDSDGSYQASLGVHGADVVMVTVEREGGAKAPTGPPVMQFNT